MRVWIIGMLLVMTGCASGPDELSGKQSKNGGPVRFERLGVVTETNVPLEAKCGRQQVMWCTTKLTTTTCKCIYKQDARERTERLARDLRRLRQYN